MRHENDIRDNTTDDHQETAADVRDDGAERPGFFARIRDRVDDALERPGDQGGPDGEPHHDQTIADDRVHEDTGTGDQDHDQTIADDQVHEDIGTGDRDHDGEGPVDEADRHGDPAPGEPADADTVGARHDGEPGAEAGHDAAGRARVADDGIATDVDTTVDGEASTGTYVGDGDPDTPAQRLDHGQAVPGESGDAGRDAEATPPDEDYAPADQHDAGDPESLAAHRGAAGMGTVEGEHGTAGMGTVDEEHGTAGMGTVDEEHGTAGMGTVDAQGDEADARAAAGTVDSEPADSAVGTTEGDPVATGIGPVDAHPGAPEADGTQDRELMPGEADAAAPISALWGEDATRDLRERWREVQLKFVDDPRAAAGEAESLISEVVQSFQQALGRYKSSLDDWHDGGEGGDTETLRAALRRYRDFFDRVLAM